MADSDHSTSLFSVTRRRLLVGTATTCLASVLHNSGPADTRSIEGTRRAPDDAFSLWQEWLAAHEKTVAACRRQQRLETRLVKEIGFPRILVAMPDEPDPVPIFLMEKLDDFLGCDPETDSLRARAQADLMAHQARWDTADETIGYSQAKHAEEEAAEHERQLAEALWATPAHSLAGVAAKLDAVLAEGEWCEDCPEFPWPQIRSALIDIVRLSELDGFFPGLTDIVRDRSDATTPTFAILSEGEKNLCATRNSPKGIDRE